MVTLTTIDELEGARLRGCRIIDVREPHEFRAGHVPGAQSMPEAQVPLTCPACADARRCT